MDWMLIDSAPKNGMAILICRFGHEKYPTYAVAYFDPDADPTHPWHVEDAGKGFNYHHDWPTHWCDIYPPQEE